MAAAVVVAAITVLLRPRRPAVLSEKDTIVLADFANSTGDPVFDGTLRQGLAVQLAQSPFLSLISEQQVQRTLRMMEQPPDARLTPGVAREVCIRTGSTAVLEGSIASLGGQYVLGLCATNCATGNVLDEEQSQAAKKEEVLAALGQIARTFRTRAGESLATVKEHDTPPAEATTPSLEALKAYSEAWKVGWSTGSVSAVPLVKRAIEIDPKFAMAYAYLGRLYGDIEESTLSRESLIQAYQLRERVSDRERFFIIANYHRQVTRNLEKARETFELWAQTYPRDAGPHSLLSGAISLAVGRYDTAVEEGKRSIELDPDRPFGYSNLADAYVYMGRLKKAENTLQRASGRKLEIPEFLATQYEIAFLKGDKAGMERTVALCEERTGAEDWISNKESSVLAYSGHLRQARRMSRRAADLAEQAGQRERAAQYDAEAAVREALFGNPREAKRGVMAALQLSRGRDVEYGAAIALALSGDSSRSEAVANDFERRFPEDTLVRFSYTPTLRALLALNQRKPASAIRLLQVASSYELGVAASRDSVGCSGALYPVYVRGLAYLAERRGAQAAGEFQKILDHRSIVFADPIGALARLQLGRAYAMQGDTAEARAAYQSFLALWKDADPGIPILKQANPTLTTGR